jgi:hypothetical protein
MGNTTSSYDASTDPCNASLQAYLSCVDAHKDGLTEGDDCSAEGEVYKACRKVQIDLKKKKAIEDQKAAPSVGSTK